MRLRLPGWNSRLPNCRPNSKHEELFRLAQKKRFGALSEKTDPNQAVNEWFDIKRRIERIVQQ